MERRYYCSFQEQLEGQKKSPLKEVNFFKVVSLRFYQHTILNITAMESLRVDKLWLRRFNHVNTGEHACVTGLVTACLTCRRRTQPSVLRFYVCMPD